MSVASTLPLIAVYGSLRRGGPANHYLQGCEWQGLDAIAGKLYQPSWFPGVKLSDDLQNTVVVDVYSLPEGFDEFSRTLDNLDTYEGFSPNYPEKSLFIRKNDVQLLGLGRPCMVYEYNREVDIETLIEDGDWINAVNNKNAA